MDSGVDSEEEEQNVEPKLTCNTTKNKVVVTAFLLLLNHQIGWETGMIGPTLMDMRDRYHTNYEHMSHAIMWRPLLAMPAGYIGGAVCDYFRSKIYLFMGFFLTIAGIVTVCLPFGGNTIYLSIMYAIQGFTHTSCGIGSKALVIVLWDKNCVIPLHWQLAAKSLGQLFAGFVVRPFLMPRNTGLFPNSTEEILTVHNNVTINSTRESLGENIIHIPYMIVGFVGIASSGAFYVMAYCSSLEENNATPTRKNIIKENKYLQICKHGHAGLLILLFISLFIGYMSLSIEEVTLSNFLLTVAVESHLHFTSSNAAILHTTHYAGRFIGRLLYGFVASCLTLKIATSMALGLLITSGAIMCFAGLEYNYVFWSSVSLHAFFAGPTGPIVLAFTNTFVPVKGMLLAMLNTGITLGAFISLAVGGTILQRHGSWTLLFFNFCVSIIMGCAVTVVFLVGKKYKELTNSSPQEEKDQNKENQPLLK